MADSLKWIFELIDKMSGPAKQISQSIGSLSSKLMSLKSANDKSIGNTKKQVDNNNYLLKSFTKLGLATAAGQIGAEAFQSALSGMVGAVGAAMNLGAAGAQFAYGAAVFRENSLIGLEAMLKSKEAANRVYNNAVRIAAVTPFETQDIIGMTQNLIGLGFKENELERVITAVGDMAAAKGMSKEVISRLGLAMGQIRAKGKLQGEELMQLSETGLSSADVYDEIGRMLGGKSRDQILKLQQAGKIGSDVAIEAILKSVEKMFGGTMDKMSRSMSGVASTLASRPFELVNAAIADKGGGMIKAQDAIKAMLDRLNESFDPNTKFGGRIVETINRIADAVSNAMPSSSQVGEAILYILEAIEMAIPAARDFIVELGDAFKSMFPATDGANRLGEAIRGMFEFATVAVAMVRGFMSGLMTIVGPILSLFFGIDPTNFIEGLRVIAEILGVVVGLGAVLVGVVLAPFIALSAAFYGIIVGVYEGVMWLVDLFNELGVNIVEGIANGIMSAGQKVYDALASVLGGAVDWAKGILGIASPSKVFASLGDYSMQGYMQGLAEPNVSGALQSALALPSSVPNFAPSNTSNTYNVTVPLSLSGADTETAKAAEAAVERLVPSALQAAFEGLSAEFGAT